MDARRPTYPLQQIQALVRAGDYRITVTAQRTAAMLDMGRSEIVSCVLGLTEDDFYKSMPAEAMPGRWQDVYRPSVAELQLYVKLQIDAQRVVVVSFKER